MADPDDPLEAFYAAHPELRPGAAAGAQLGNMFKPAGAAPTVAKPTTGGGKPPAAPAGPPPIPEGFKPGPTPGQILRLDGFAGMTLDPKTNQYVQDLYAPSAVTLAAAGIVKGGGGGGTSRTGSTAGGTSGKPATNYAAQNLADKTSTLINTPGISQKDALVAQGARALGDNTLILPNGDKYSLRSDGTGLYGAFGRASATDMRALGSQMMTESQQNRTGTSPAPLTSIGNTFGPAMTPGQTDTRTTGLNNALNQIQVHNPGTGFNGFINKQEGVRAPAGQGFGPAVSSNLQTFSQGARGTTEDPNPYPQLSYTTAKSFDPTTGFNDQGFATPQQIGVTFGAPNYSPDPFANASSNTVPITMAGSNVNFSAPDRSWGTGFVRDAMPASNIGLAQGRDFSGLNPAAQSAATFAMLNAQMGGALTNAYRTDEDQLAFGGYGVDGGTRFMAGGGRVRRPPFRFARY